MCGSLALGSAPRASCESLGTSVGSRGPSWSARAVRAAPPWDCVSGQTAIGFASCLKKSLPPAKGYVRGQREVGRRGTVLRLFRQFKMPGVEITIAFVFSVTTKALTQCLTLCAFFSLVASSASQGRAELKLWAAGRFSGSSDT